jgi:hypothetical protein
MQVEVADPEDWSVVFQAGCDEFVLGRCEASGPPAQCNTAPHVRWAVH